MNSLRRSGAIETIARKWNYDLNAMVAALQDMERHPQCRLVDRRKAAPNQGMQPAAERRS
jgi:hypothetical protein